MSNATPLPRVPMEIVRKYNLQICLDLEVPLGGQIPIDLYYVARVELHNLRIYHIYLHNAEPTIEKVGLDDQIHQLVVTETLEVFYRNSQKVPYDLVGPLSAMHVPLLFDFFGSAADGLRELRGLLLAGRLHRN